MATYVGDTPLISYDCSEDVSDFTIYKLYYRKPNGTTGEWAAALSGTDYVQYQAVTADLDEDGVWLIHPHLTDGTKVFHGAIKPLMIHAPVK